MTKSTAREKTISMMPVKAPLNKYTVPASTYYPFQQQKQQQQVATRVVPYMPTYQNMFAKMPTYKMPTYPSMVAKRPVVIGYPTQVCISTHFTHLNMKYRDQLILLFVKPKQEH